MISFRTLSAVGCLLWALPAGSAEVYRWTDEQGQVHFSQRPPPAGAEPLDLSDTAPVNSYGDSGLQQRRARERRLLESYEYERERKRAREAREAEERSVAAAKCRELADYWRRLSFPGPVYLRREGGDREYLSDERRAAERARIRPAYVRHCGRAPQPLD